MQAAQQFGGSTQASGTANPVIGQQLMSPKQNYRDDIQQMMLDCRKRLEASDRADIREMGRVGDQYASLSKLLEVAS